MSPVQRVLAAALIGAGLGAGVAHAEVTARAAEGFVVSHQLDLAGSPDRVYRAITEEVSDWWDAAHSYSGRAGNFSLDARAGGCFCERLPDGGSVEHLRVVMAAPGKLLRMTGGLGPLQSLGASGAMDFALAPGADGRTTLSFTYTVGGFVPDGLGTMAEPVDQVLAGQLGRLEDHLEKHREPAPSRR